MFKKLLSFVALTAIIASLFPMTAFADDVGPTVVLTNNISDRTEVRDADTVIITATFTDADGIDDSPAAQPMITIDNGGVSREPMTATASNLVWTYSWNVPTGDFSDCLVQIAAVDTVGNDSQDATGVTTYKIDNTAPVVTVSALETTDTTPAITGTVDSDAAILVVRVNDIDYSNAINGAGTITLSGAATPYTWTLADNKITPPLTPNTYNVTATATDVAGNSAADATSGELVISQLPVLTISSFTATPATGFDPSSSGQNEDLTITYEIALAPNSVSVEIKNSNGVVVKPFSSSDQSGTFVWDGEYTGKIVEPGTYTVTLTAAKTGYVSATDSKTVVVEYADPSKPSVSGFTVTPSSFDPDEEDAVVEFTNNNSAKITVEIRDSNEVKVRGFSDYENNDFTSNDNISISWDGKNDSGSKVSTGTYKVTIVVRNEYGVSVYQQNVAVTNTGSSTPASNSHISGISFSPSTTFEPAEDDELEIEFDILKDLDELKIYAKKGTTEVELSDETDISKDSNVDITWDGTNDSGDYVANGTWKIEFRSKEGTTSLVAAKSINVFYAKPSIGTMYVSKDKIDNDRGEFTYVMFKINDDALVDVNILESNKKDDTLTEDLEIVKNKWYAVQFDGDGYEYDDDIDLEVIAKNKANETVYETKKISVDLAEDKVSSSKSNVTNDFISPVLTSGSEEMELYYELEEEADVTITIHKGKSSTGTKMIELVDVNDQESGSHTVVWNGKDSKGKKFASGVYTYKIISKQSSTDTEIGYFMVGSVGEIEGEASGSGSSDDGGNTGVSPNVVIDGQGSSGSTVSGLCAGFPDILLNSSSCEAIQWTKNAGIFQGYVDGTFQPFKPINRVEVLKVVLKAIGVTVDLSNYSSYGLGFVDMVDGAWYIPFVRGAKLLGIFSGDGGGKNTARPTESVSRAEVLKFAFESLKAGKNYQLGVCSSSPFTDVLAANWYFKYACVAKTYSLFTSGIILGPNVPATRSEVASVLYKLHTSGLF